MARRGQLWIQARPPQVPCCWSIGLGHLNCRAVRCSCGWQAATPLSFLVSVRMDQSTLFCWILHNWMQILNTKISTLAPRGVKSMVTILAQLMKFKEIQLQLHSGQRIATSTFRNEGKNTIKSQLGRLENRLNCRDPTLRPQAHQFLSTPFQNPYLI